MSLPEPVPPKIQVAWDQLGETEAEMLETALTRRDRSGYAVTAEALETALRNLGAPVSATTIKTYRRTVVDQENA